MARSLKRAVSGLSPEALGIGHWALPYHCQSLDGQLAGIEEFARRVRLLADELFMETLGRATFVQWALSDEDI